MPPVVFFNSCRHALEPKTFVFSQFHPAPIKTGGKTYWCNEQYYQSRKALIIKKHRCPKKANAKSRSTCDSLYQDIMDEKRSALRIAGMARDFILQGAAWDEWCEEQKRVLYTANYCKFKQNFDERAKLMATGNAPLAEASKNRVCGIGYFERDALEHSDDWGDNLLGLALERVRAELNVEMKKDQGPFMAYNSPNKVDGNAHNLKHHDQRANRAFGYTYNPEIPAPGVQKRGSESAKLPAPASGGSGILPPSANTAKASVRDRTSTTTPKPASGNRIDSSTKRKVAGRSSPDASPSVRKEKAAKQGASSRQSPPPPKFQKLPSIATSAAPYAKSAGNELAKHLSISGRVSLLSEAFDGCANSCQSEPIVATASSTKTIPSSGQTFDQHRPEKPLQTNTTRPNALAALNLDLDAQLDDEEFEFEIDQEAIDAVNRHSAKIKAQMLTDSELEFEISYAHLHEFDFKLMRYEAERVRKEKNLSQN